MDVTWPQAGTWAGAACAALAIVAWWLVRRARKRDAREEEYKARLADVRVAEDALEDSYANATDGAEVRKARSAVDEARRRADAVRKALHIAAVLLAVAALAGCVTRTREVERIVQLDEHIRIIAPGDTVPDYAPGESRWWLVSPTGLVEMMPKYRQEDF